MNKRKQTLLMMLILTLLFSITAYAEPHESDKAFDNKIVKRINVDRIYNDIAFLSENPRVAGTKEEDAAVQYINSEFQSYGYETDVQPFEFLQYIEPTSITFSIESMDQEWSPRHFTYSPSGEVTSHLVFAGLGTKEELANIDIDGKIAVIQRGNISFGEKVSNAAEKGAKAVVIFNNEDGTINGTLGSEEHGVIPVMSLSKEEGEAIVQKLHTGETLTATVKIEGAETKQSTSHNVIAIKKATHKQKDTNQIVIIGAHHDSVPGAPGANDDASGTATVLELARVMANMPTDTELRFITFGAEEYGLLGSYAYANSLTKDEINRTVGMFQLDMVGSRDAGDLVMFTADGKKNIVTDLGAAAGSRLSDVIPYAHGGRSDHVPFAELGIPAALFIHSPVEPWYHTPEDTIDKISKEKLQEVAQIVGSSVYQVARPETPALQRSNVAPIKVDYPEAGSEL